MSKWRALIGPWMRVSITWRINLSFKEKESLSVRSLFISTESRSALEALTLAGELTASDMTTEQFETVVREHTEDPNSEDGKIPNLTRGMTVREFEEAAFSLTDIGQLSEPVLSRYGAHVIQLINRKPPAYRTFESVEEQLITQLKKGVLLSSVTLREPSPTGIRQMTLSCIKRSSINSCKRLRPSRRQTDHSCQRLDGVGRGQMMLSHRLRRLSAPIRISGCFCSWTGNMTCRLARIRSLRAALGVKSGSIWLMAEAALLMGAAGAARFLWKLYDLTAYSRCTRLSWRR